MRIGLGLGITNNRRADGNAELDADASAYIDAVETADGQELESGVKTAINDFVVGCKADGIWTALKASCILAGARTLNGCLVPLVGTAPTNFNFVSADYSRKTGMVGDGTTKYINSNRANNADPQNNQHLSVWVSAQIRARGSNSFYIGDEVNVIGCSSIGRSGGNSSSLFAQSRSKTSTSSSAIFNDLDPVPTGFQGVTRSVSNEFSARQNGTTITDSGSDANSAAPTSGDITIFKAGSIWSIERMTFYSIGESIDLAALDARLDTLMTALDGAIA